MEHSLNLGMSLFNTPPEDIGGFIDEGFTFFEISLPGNMCSPGNETPYVDESMNYFRVMRQHCIQPWSFHLPFARHWDISARDEDMRKLALGWIVQVDAPRGRCGTAAFCDPWLRC